MRDRTVGWAEGGRAESHGRGGGLRAPDKRDAGERGSASSLSEKLRHWLLFTLKT